MLKDGERFAFWSEFQQTRAQEGLLDAKRGSGCSRERRSLRMNGRRERDGGTAQSPRTPNRIRKSRHHRRSPILWTMNPVCLPRVHGRMHGDGERAGADSRGGVGLERGLERPLHVLRHRQTQHRLVELRSPGSRARNDGIPTAVRFPRSRNGNGTPEPLLLHHVHSNTNTTQPYFLRATYHPISMRFTLLTRTISATSKMNLGVPFFSDV